MNPPYDEIDTMIEEVTKKKAAAVTMILPEWKHTSWYSKVEKYIVKRWTSGSRVFHGPPGFEHEVRGTPWPVIVVYLPDGNLVV